MSDNTPTDPGSEELRKILADHQHKAKVTSGAGLEIVFDETPLGSGPSYLRHQVIATTDVESKIVLLACKVGTTEAALISGLLRKLTHELNISGTFAECEVSPVIAKQLDYVMFQVPTARAASLRNYLVKEVEGLFS